MSGPWADSKCWRRCLELKEKQCLEAPLSPFAMSGSGGNGTNELLVDKLGFNLSKINFVPKSQVGQFNVLPPCLFSKVASHL